jgi:hypothetical protein
MENLDFCNHKRVLKLLSKLLNLSKWNVGNKEHVTLRQIKGESRRA